MLCVIVTLFVQFEKRENTHEGVLLFNKVSEFSQQLYWKYHSSMGVFHIFKITQMVPNCAKRLRCWPIFPLTYLALTNYSKNNVDPKCFHTILQCQHFMRHRKKAWKDFGPILSLYRNFLSRFEDEYVKAGSTGKCFFKVWNENIRKICHMLCLNMFKVNKIEYSNNVELVQTKSRINWRWFGVFINPF